MAYEIASGYIFNNAALPVSAWPVTMACWFKVPNVFEEQSLMYIGDYDNNPYAAYLTAQGAVGGDPILAATRDAGLAFAQSSAGFTANTWFHAAGVWASNTSRAAYLNGANKGTNTTSKTWPASQDFLSIGRIRQSNAWHVTPEPIIAEAGVWSAELTDADVAALGKGVSPLKVRPQSLVFYVPLAREVIDVKAALALTTSGLTVAAHPRIYY